VLKKRSVSIRGHQTSLTLEDEFWNEVKFIAEQRAMPLAQLIAEIDDARTPDENLSSALRLYVLDWVKNNPATQ